MSLEILISPIWNLNKWSVFLLMFSDVIFHIKTFSTNMTFSTLSIWLFKWKRHFRQCNVKSVENITKRNENNRTPTKKRLDFFLVPVWRFQYFKHLLQNPNLKLMASFLHNHYWAYNFLRPWDLGKNVLLSRLGFD